MDQSGFHPSALQQTSHLDAVCPLPTVDTANPATSLPVFLIRPHTPGSVFDDNELANALPINATSVEDAEEVSDGALRRNSFLAIGVLGTDFTCATVTTTGGSRQSSVPSSPPLRIGLPLPTRTRVPTNDLSSSGTRPCPSCGHHDGAAAVSSHSIHDGRSLSQASPSRTETFAARRRQHGPAGSTPKSISRGPHILPTSSSTDLQHVRRRGAAAAPAPATSQSHKHMATATPSLASVHRGRTVGSPGATSLHSRVGAFEAVSVGGTSLAYEEGEEEDYWECGPDGTGSPLAEVQRLRRTGTGFGTQATSRRMDSPGSQLGQLLAQVNDLYRDLIVPPLPCPCMRTIAASAISSRTATTQDNVTVVVPIPVSPAQYGQRDFGIDVAPLQPEHPDQGSPPTTSSNPTPQQQQKGQLYNAKRMIDSVSRLSSSHALQHEDNTQAGSLLSSLVRDHPAKCPPDVGPSDVTGTRSTGTAKCGGCMPPCGRMQVCSGWLAAAMLVLGWCMLGAALVWVCIAYFEGLTYIGPVCFVALLVLRAVVLVVWHVVARVPALKDVIQAASPAALTLGVDLRQTCRVAVDFAARKICVMNALFSVAVFFSVPCLLVPALATTTLQVEVKALVGAVVTLSALILSTTTASVVSADHLVAFELTRRLLVAFIDEVKNYRFHSLHSTREGYIDHQWAIGAHFRLRNVVSTISDQYAGKVLVWTALSMLATFAGIASIAISRPIYNPALVTCVVLTFLSCGWWLVPVVQLSSFIFKIRKECNDMVGAAALDRNLEQHRRLRKLQHYLSESDLDVEVFGILISPMFAVKLASGFLAAVALIARESLLYNR